MTRIDDADLIHPSPTGAKKRVLWAVVSAKPAGTRAARIAAIVQRGLAGEPLVP